MFYNCFKCNKVSPLIDDSDKCPLCGLTSGEIVSNSRIYEGMKAGVFFNVDVKTGKRVKKKR